jgi:murein L,D-transpeptidase YcbB/YkuD
MKDDPARRDNPPLPSSPAAEVSQGPVSYWRPFLWEAVPGEWLRDSKQGVLLEYYQQHDWQPFFITSRFELNQGAQVLLQRLESLDSDAINPKPYQLERLRKCIANLEQTRTALAAVDPNYRDARANLGEISGTDAFHASKPSPPPVQLAMDSPQPVGQVVDPAQKKDKEQKYREAFRSASELDIKLTHDLLRLAKELNPFSGETQLEALSGQIPMAQFLKELEPTSPHYEPLHRAFGKYRHLATQGGQVPFKEKGPTHLGESGNHIRTLQKRLQQEDFYAGKITGSYDEATKQALLEFQRSHLLEPDGAVGQKTKEWLNVPFARKTRMITQSMQALRQSNTRIHDRYVRINIPQFMLEYYKEGKVQDTQRVIVGKAAGKKIKLQGRMIGENQTPTLYSYIENVVFNPRWYVSDRIRRELDDAIAADPAYFSKHGYVQMSAMYPWGDRRLFQLPGPTNPLGRVKFEFANAYAVFLHDTPKKQLFSRSRRDFSHGCVRMEGALRLAKMILKDDQNPAAEKADSYITTAKQAYVKLNQPVPIIIEYIPALTNGNGQLVFCGDPYGWLDEAKQNT